jgi:hypothetical protein
MSPLSPILTLLFMSLAGIGFVVWMIVYRRKYPFQITPKDRRTASIIGIYIITLSALSIYFDLRNQVLASRIILVFLPAGILILLGAPRRN